MSKTTTADLAVGEAITRVPEERFAFGRNWAHFLAHLTPARIVQATLGPHPP